MNQRRLRYPRILTVLAAGWAMLATGTLFGDERPNVLWIVVEDASPHIGCYGETTIETPHIDEN